MTVVARRLAMSRQLETADFDYHLPAELIAQTPLQRRDDSRLMVLDRVTGAIHHSQFNRLSEWLAPGDLIVANNSRVIPARLHGNRVPSGGAVEILLLRKLEAGSWSALGKPAKRLKRGDRMEFACPCLWHGARNGDGRAERRRRGTPSSVRGRSR